MKEGSVIHSCCKRVISSDFEVDQSARDKTGLEGGSMLLLRYEGEGQKTQSTR